MRAYTRKSRCIAQVGRDLRMFSTGVARWMAGRNLHYGWMVAATTFLTMLATAGAMVDSRRLSNGLGMR